jgi:hypothetical protein
VDLDQIEDQDVGEELVHRLFRVLQDVGDLLEAGE